MKKPILLFFLLCLSMGKPLAGITFSYDGLLFWADKITDTECIVNGDSGGELEAKGNISIPSQAFYKYIDEKGVEKTKSFTVKKLVVFLAVQNYHQLQCQIP